MHMCINWRGSITNVWLCMVEGYFGYWFKNFTCAINTFLMFMVIIVFNIGQYNCIIINFKFYEHIIHI